MKRKLLVMLVIACCIAMSASVLTACGNKPTITLDKTSVTLAIEESVTLVPTVSDDTLEVSWSSSDSSVAKVNSYGVVIAQSLGTATITASVKGAKATCTVKVEPVVTLNQTEIKLMSGEDVTADLNQFQLLASFNPVLGKDEKATWTSSDEKVATVDENGLVTAVAAGTATITVKAPNGAEAKATVTVEDLNTDPAEITFTVTVPEELPDYVNVYIIGNNTGSWSTLSDDNKLTKDSADGKKYSIVLTLDFEADDSLSRQMQYKYVLANANGSVNWSFVEKGPQGEELSNRTLFVNGGASSVQDVVASWGGIPGDPNVTVTTNLKIILNIPEATTDDIYVIGGFPSPYANWGKDDTLKMTKVSDTQYSWEGTLTTSDLTLAFKFNNGSWHSDTNPDGNEIILPETLPEGVSLSGGSLNVTLIDGDLTIEINSDGWMY